MQEEKQSLRQHIANLEAELAIKDFEMRKKDVCDWECSPSDFQEFISDLNTMLAELRMMHECEPESFESRRNQKENVLLQRVLSMRERVLTELSGIEAGMGKPRGHGLIKAGMNDSDTGITEKLKLELHDARAETKQLRDCVSGVESEMKALSDRVASSERALSQLIHQSSDALASGLVEFCTIRGSSMTRSSLRFVCLGKDIGQVFHTDNIVVEHTITYADFIARGKLDNGHFIMEFSSRRDTFTFRLKVSATDKEKWRWAYEKLFNGLFRQHPPISSHVSTDRRGINGLRESDHSGSDGDSVVGSLSSLASEVRMGIAPYAQKAVDDKRNYRNGNHHHMR